MTQLLSTCSFKISCVARSVSFPGAAGRLWLLCAFLLLSFGCFAQGPALESQAKAGRSPGQADLFNLVIANQKQLDTDLNLFERMERTEFRKTASDPKPSEIKLWRVFPSGTGASRILLSPEGKPPSAESYHAALEKLETTLVWAAQDGPAAGGRSGRGPCRCHRSLR